MEKTDPQQGATTASKSMGNTRTPPTSNKAEWRALFPVPNDAPPPPETHYKHGKPSMRWQYHNAEGELLCVVSRFEPKTETERKQFCPLTFCEDATSKRKEWRWQGLPDPRPLYHLDQLAARPDALVIVTEGEKAADAAALLFPDAVAVTMLNGAQAPHKTDWTALKGRTVTLWPDNDAAGLACMTTVANLLGKAGVRELRQINPAAFFGDGLAVPDKWDAADAVADGFTAERAAVLLENPDLLQAIQAAPAKNSQTPTEPETPEHRRPYFTLVDDGVYFNGVKDGSFQPPWWICSKLEITAVTRDSKGEAWGRLLEFDDLDGVRHAWACPMELFKGDASEFRGVLLSMGLQMSATTSARNLLVQYVQTAKVEARARCVERTGWHGSVFVMPDKTIGEADERILYQSAATAPSAFKQEGTLADWQKHIAAPCAGNSRLVFAISAAFAAPLLHITGMESGGLHYRGDSSTGKTTALRVAASVWGGLDYLQQWRATDNGLEGLSAQRSDCLLVLDELSQVDPKMAGEVAYMLANGGGKVRGHRAGGMRDTASWRLLFLSSGEAGLTEHMALANRKPKAGQEIRLLDIPADAGCGLGLFDTLNDYASGAVFSKILTEATGKYYGTPALAYLEKLTQRLDKLSDMVKKLQREFTAQHLPDDAGGQAARAASRFAIVAAAGEIASVWGVTGWQSGEATAAAAICFKAWLAQRGGAGNQEQAAMLAQVRKYFEMHGESAFTDWDRPVSETSQHPPKTVNRAGYRKHSDAKDEAGNRIYLDGIDKDGLERTAKETEYFVFPEAFEKEICKGLDYRAVRRLLADQGILMTEGERFTRKERLPGEGLTRCYRITSKIYGGDDA